MERQYIGARYVPKFADPIEWNSGMTYEPLTIVTYLGASYTSKKAVPAGVNPTNTGYWVVTGNYNAQVEEYRQAVVGVTEDYNKRFKRKWIFLGDSYDATSGWISRCANLLNLASGDYYNLAVSGHGFSAGIWLNDIKSWVSANPNEVKNIGNIVIGGGLNDSIETVAADLGAQIQAFGEYCKNTFDDVIVSLAYFGWEIDSVESAHPSTPIWRNYAQYQYSLAAYFGMRYLNGCEMVMHRRSFMDADGVHPNINGGNHIATMVANAIKTGSATFDNTPTGGTFTPVTGTPGGHISQSTSGKTIFTEIAISVVGLNATLEGANGYEIGTLVLPYSNGFPRQQIMLTYQDTSGVYHTEPFYFSIDKDKLLIACLALTEDGSTYKGADIATINPTNIQIAHNAMCD